MQKFFVYLIPIVLAAILTTISFNGSTPGDIPGYYAATFLSFIGYYCRLAIIIQLAYVFIILHHYIFNFRIYLSHPDKCSGLAPFGRLAISIYLYLFISAIMQAIGTLTGGTWIEIALKDINNMALSIHELIYVWIVFPIACF
jgi:hypothetical protein